MTMTGTTSTMKSGAQGSGRLLGGITGAFLLRDAEGWARKLDEGDRKLLFVQLARAQQKLESARLLWAHEQYVEGLRLAEESVNEALRAAELGAGVLAGVPQGGTVRPPWGDVLNELGASQDELDEAVVASGGPMGTRPTWNGELRPENRRYFRQATRVAESVLERLSPLVSAPRKIVVARWVRVAGAIAVVAAALFTFVSLWTAVDVRPSASFSEVLHGPKNLIDGNPKTEWLLPNNITGWVEVSFRPRKLTKVAVMNARNLPYNERGTQDFRIELYRDKKQVFTSKQKFPKFDEKEAWITVPVPGLSVDTIKLVIESHHKVGGGFAELSWR
jgi:hypothetical protein